ncbi:hypothetical protein HUJ04_012344 [Dendroctonus ponderosae]|nr:hypothetical protein HUJ04_012344 [Dendroctonus ponderosae]KAH1029521.1 hypothetical protein HUJ05_002747 [Dendroctonus ponderosae]
MFCEHANISKTVSFSVLIERVDFEAIDNTPQLDCDDNNYIENIGSKIYSASSSALSSSDVGIINDICTLSTDQEIDGRNKELQTQKPFEQNSNEEDELL